MHKKLLFDLQNDSVQGPKSGFFVVGPWTGQKPSGPSSDRMPDRVNCGPIGPVRWSLGQNSELPFLYGDFVFFFLSEVVFISIQYISSSLKIIFTTQLDRFRFL